MSSIAYIVIFQSLSRVTSWTAARQASLPLTISWSLLKLMDIELVMPSSRLILCRPPFILPAILDSIRVWAVWSLSWLSHPEVCGASYGLALAMKILPLQTEYMYYVCTLCPCLWGS